MTSEYTFDYMVYYHTSPTSTILNFFIFCDHGNGRGNTSSLSAAGAIYF